VWAYSVELTKDDNGTFLVTSPDLPEVTTFGKTVGAALRHGRDAIEEAIAARMADREPIPNPSKAKSEYRIGLSSQAVAKIMLYRAMLKKGMNKSQLARSLRCHRPQVDRLLNIRHQSSWEKMDEAFAALGATMRIEVEFSAA
jgi:antitoxin HicB